MVQIPRYFVFLIGGAYIFWFGIAFLSIGNDVVQFPLMQLQVKQFIGISCMLIGIVDYLRYRKKRDKGELNGNLLEG